MCEHVGHVEVTGHPVGVELFPLWFMGSRHWAQEKNLLRISLDKPFPAHDSSWTPFPTSPSQIHVLFYHDDDDDSDVTCVSPVSVAHVHLCTRLTPEACTAYQGAQPSRKLPLPPLAAVTAWSCSSWGGALWLLSSSTLQADWWDLCRSWVGSRGCWESSWVQHPHCVQKTFTVALLVLWFLDAFWALDVRVVSHMSHLAWAFHSHLVSAFWPVIILCGVLHLQQKDVSLLTGGSYTIKKALQFQNQRTPKHSANCLVMFIG